MLQIPISVLQAVNAHLNTKGRQANSINIQFLNFRQILSHKTKNALYQFMYIALIYT